MTAPEEAPRTGHPQVDAAVAAVVTAQDAPAAEQVAALSRAQQVLAETLDTIDPDA